jgi:hypothetical protein
MNEKNCDLVRYFIQESNYEIFLMYIHRWAYRRIIAMGRIWFDIRLSWDYQISLVFFMK